MATKPKSKSEPEPVSENQTHVAPVSETVTAATLNDSVAMPEPSERTIAAMAEDDPPPAAQPPAPADTTPTAAPVNSAPAPAPAGPEPSPGDLDKFGRVYDPVRHFPRQNSRGSWIPRGGGRPRADGTRPNSVVGGADAARSVSVSPLQPAGPDRYEVAAEMYCRMGYGIFGAVFGAVEEWQPENQAEHESVKVPLAVYLRSKQTDDLPPGLTVLLAIGIYAVPRLEKPKTKAKVVKLVRMIAGKKDTPPPQHIVTAPQPIITQNETGAN